MATLTGYLVARANYLTIDLPPLTYALNAEPPNEITGGVFRVFLAQHLERTVASFMGGRIGSPYGKWAPNRLERGFRVIVVEYDWPADVWETLFPAAGGNPGELDAPHGERTQVLLSRADAVDELTAEDVYALVPDRPPNLLSTDVNYKRQRNSLQALMG